MPGWRATRICVPSAAGAATVPAARMAQAAKKIAKRESKLIQSSLSSLPCVSCRPKGPRELTAEMLLLIRMDCKRIAIPTGDPAGIGPEISLKAALDPAVRAACNPIVVSDPALLARHAKACG